MNYWFLKKWDNSEVRVKGTPANLQLIQEKLNSGEGYITGPTGSVAVRDVKEFYESDIPVAQETNLISLGEDAARAFEEPLFTEDGDVIARAVKKRVTRRKYDSFYAHHPSYKYLSEDDTHVWVGFRVPTHLVDPNKVQVCTPEEANVLGY